MATTTYVVKMTPKKAPHACKCRTGRKGNMYCTCVQGSNAKGSVMGRFPYKQTVVGASSVPPTLSNWKRGLDFNCEPGPSRGEAGTFLEDMFGIKPETEKPVAPRRKDMYCSKEKTKFFETEEGKCALPNAWLIFQALHKKCDWMQDKQLKLKNYAIWKQELYTNPKYAGRTQQERKDLIMEKFQKIIEKNHLNPSERPYGFSGGASKLHTLKRCPPGPNCYFDGTNCVEPDFKAYWQNEAQPDYYNLPKVQQQQQMNNWDREYKALPDKCAYFRGEDLDEEYYGV